MVSNLQLQIRPFLMRYYKECIASAEVEAQSYTNLMYLSISVTTWLIGAALGWLRSIEKNRLARTWKLLLTVINEMYIQEEKVPHHYLMPPTRISHRGSTAMHLGGAIHGERGSIFVLRGSAPKFFDPTCQKCSPLAQSLDLPLGLIILDWPNYPF